MENNHILVIDDKPKAQEIYKDILVGSSVKEKEAALDQEAAILFGEKAANTPLKFKKKFEVIFASQD